MALLDRFFRPATPELTVIEQESKAVTGAGAFAMQYDVPISSGRWDTPRGMKRAQALSHANPWIDKAERLITGRAKSLPWHLEDGDAETVDDEARPEIRAIRDLLERPNETMTWSQLTQITYRHLGVCNVGAWYLDSLNGFGIPEAILYLNPARLTPYNVGGVLTKWILDQDNDYGWNARFLELDEVLLFTLDPPDYGYFGTGLVEVAEGKAALSKATDRFATQTYSSGGRRGSWIGPREGRLPDDVYDALVANMKNIRESPDATKRDIITKAPLDITPQSATPTELQAVELMSMSRDDLLVIWGVDVADAGIPGGAGLSSGQLRAQARQSTFENGIEPRVDALRETVQLRLLDRWKAAGITVELVIDKPQFEDETPAYERAAKVIQIPLRNRERRDILGLEPFGDPLLDEAVWLPFGMAEVFMAPDKDGNVPTEPESEVIAGPSEQPLLEQPEPPAKASPLGRTRDAVDARITPKMRRDVAKVLDTAKADVVRLVKDKAGHLIAKPSDVRAVFNEKAFAEALAKALRPTMTGTAELVANETKRTLGHLNPSKAEPAFLDDVVSFVLRRGGERVVEMTNTTRDAITSAIKDVVSAGASQGLGPSEIADRLTDTVGSLSTWSPERAETIARTESMFAYNDAAITSYREYGVDRVEAIDGDEDSECANRNGQTFTLDEALGIADHPNGTLDWLPVIKAVLEPEPESEMVLAVKALTEVAMRPHPQPIVNVYPADVNVTTPDVHVTSPDIHVHPAAVNVTVPPAKPTTKRVERDDDGRITGITED